MDEEAKLEGEHLLNTESKFNSSKISMLVVFLDI